MQMSSNLKLLNMNDLVNEYITLKDQDDDFIATLKTRLKKLPLADLRLIVVWIEYNQNYGLCARYFNTTVYFIKKRLKNVISKLKWKLI